MNGITVEVPVERYDYYLTQEGRRRAAEDYINNSDYPRVDMIAKILGLNVKTKKEEELPMAE